MGWPNIYLKGLVCALNAEGVENELHRKSTKFRWSLRTRGV